MQASTKIMAAFQQVSTKAFEYTTAIRLLNKHELVRDIHTCLYQSKLRE